MARFVLVWSVVAVVGCSDPGGGGGDAGSGGPDASALDSGSGAADSGSGDSGAADSGTVDSGTVDSGTGDSGTADGGPRDAGSADGSTSSMCDEDLGAPCTDACPTGLECNVGRCTPQGRDLCGGFSGAECTDPTYPHCLYFESADFGTCVKPEERDCLCARAPGSFPECTAAP